MASKVRRQPDWNFWRATSSLQILEINYFRCFIFPCDLNLKKKRKRKQTERSKKVKNVVNLYCAYIHDEMINCALHMGTLYRSNGNWKMFWLLRREENRSTRRKTSRSKDENQQQTQPTYDAESGNRTRVTLVGGECSHHSAIPAPLKKDRG